MFHFIFIIILFQYKTTLILATSYGQNDGSDTCHDCTCDLEIDAVRKFIENLETVQKRVDEIGIEISLMQKELRENRKSKPSSCMEAAAGSLKSGQYFIQLENLDAKPFAVWCHEDIDYGGWLVIQRRESDSVDFYRGWQDYKNGFGIVNGNYWIGLEKLHILTSGCEQELYIEMKRFSGENYYAKYSEFVIGSEWEEYALKKLGNYTGNAMDSLAPQVGKKFTTFDRDNDESTNNCARLYEGAWWFKKCYNSHLNARYKNGTGEKYGVNWNGIKAEESLKFTQMMIRPTEKCLKRMSLRS